MVSKKSYMSGPEATKTRIKASKSIAFRSIASIIVMMAAFSLIIGYIGYSKFSASILEQYTDGAFLTASTAEDIVDGEDLYRYNLSNGDTGDYRETFNELQMLCNSTDSAFIYVIQPDTTDYAHIRFVFSVASYDSGFIPYEFGYLRETTNDEYRRKYRSLYEQRTFSEVVIRDTGYIETKPHITAMVPLRGSDNKVKGILCVQRQLDKLEEVRNNYIKSVLLALSMLAVLIITMQWASFRKMLLDPVRKITEEAHRFANENVMAENKLTSVIRNDDEIGVLAGSIDQMEERIHDYIEYITRITAENERIDAELSLANRIQENMLPKDFPAFPGRSEFSIYALMRPAKEVGGDFYDFFLIDDDHLGIVIADVSGKGIPAALFMMVSMIVIKNHTITGIGPARVLELVNEQICSSNTEEMFVTVWLGVLDLKKGIITAANAGHEYPAIMQPGGDFEILKDKHGFVVGGMPGMKYTEYDIVMEKGSKLFVYTDGLAEAQNNSSELFGTERMTEVLNSVKGESPETIINEMTKATDAFADGAPQFDDLTMLCLEYDGD